MMHSPNSAVTRSTVPGEHARGRVITDKVGIAAVGLVTADAADLADLRADPGLVPDGRTPRHADEQTVLALAAVHRAAAAALGPFDDWGVIVAPRWQGRSGTAAFVERFHAVGVRGIGPQAIPNLCLHAGAATVSLCLAAHGPVFGAGGGPAHVTDGLLAAMAVQLNRDTPGTWLAITEWDGDETTGRGRAVALALIPAIHRGAPWTLSLRPGASLTRPALRPEPPPVRLADLADFFTDPVGDRWDGPFDGGEFSLMAGSAP